MDAATAMFGCPFNLPRNFQNVPNGDPIDISLLTRFRDQIINATIVRNLSDYQFEAKKRFDATHRMINFSEGDAVMAKIYPEPPKGSHPFHGPFIIDTITPGRSHRLRTEGGEVLPHKYAATQLLALDKDPEPKEEYYEIDYVKASRCNQKGDSEYLIHWRGYNSEDDTWEPAAHFEDTSIIEQFETANKSIKRVRIEHPILNIISFQTTTHIQNMHNLPQLNTPFTRLDLAI